MRILFLGNSYTYFNQMPQMLTELCREHGVELTTDQVTQGGYSFAHYASDENEHARRFRELLKENRYDVVVLQEQSVRPAQSPDTFRAGLAKLLPLIRENGAEAVLYETWGRRDGHETLIKNGWTHEQMQEKLRDAYRAAGKEFGLRVVPAGERFHEAYRRGEEVFHADGTHPSPLGSRIVAQAFRDELFRK